MTHHPAPTLTAESLQLSGAAYAKVRSILLAIAVLGWLGCLAGVAVDRAQFHFSYMVSYSFFTTILIGALFFVMLQHVGGAAWSVTVRRIAENFMVIIPISLVLFIPNALGLGFLYEWSHLDVVKADRILMEKSVVMNPPLFLLRVVLYFAVWTYLAVKLYRLSVDTDHSKDLAKLAAAKKWAAIGLVALTVLVTQAAYDWLMSLDPHWYSTMFGVYIYAGAAMSFIGVLVLVSLGLRRNGILADAITVEHYHDLGKLLFAFTVFWAYCAFSQYMLIWYSNLPEETAWFYHRTKGGWSFALPVLIFGHFLIPFLALMARGAKRTLGVLGGLAVWILVMHWFDLFWIITPGLHKDGPVFHWLDLAALLAVGGTVGLVFLTRLKKHAMVPVGDFRLNAALQFRNY